MKILNTIARVARSSALAPLKLTRILSAPITKPVESMMSDMLKNALMSAVKKLLRTLVATGLLVLITVIPQAEEIFKQAQGSGDVLQKTVFGVVIGGLVALLAFVERMKAQMDAQPKS